ncbi:hypothetical protein CHS0354_008077 [Potamilus streckersoni]|uniref:Ig-like domain-containing protein n=1 Tax=Potamilus streckersoni TaxID=2493646 RepID=A0AAE0S8A7_9BIVA|nr:hypothetical protein CHS0354_008077 [Potamilus streckersoni]
MTGQRLYCIQFLITLAVASKVTLDFNKIATFDAIGVDCRVKDREKESVIKIFHGGMEKVALSAGCIINSNDTRLNISCTETENDILLSVNLTYYNNTDQGTWNCSDGKSFDTVTFPYFANFPEQPVISLHETESNVGIYELLCASESKSQPMLARKQLSFIWRLNGHNLTEMHQCFRLSGPVLLLCPDACEQLAKGNISITCAAEEDGLESNESQPFIIPISRVVTAESKKGFDNLDHQINSIVGTLVGACLGSLITGIIIGTFSVIFVTKRGSICIKEHREKERTNDVPIDSMYVNSIMSTAQQRPECEVRQYESLDPNAIEHRRNQYDVICSKGSGQKQKEDAYEIV